MMKFILPITTTQNNIHHTLTQRALFILSFLLLNLGEVWGVNWSDGSSAKDMGTFQTGTPTTPTGYSFNVFDYVSLEDMLAAVNQAAGTNYDTNEFWQHFYARWEVIRSDGSDVPNWNPDWDDGNGETGWRSLKGTNADNYSYYKLADSKYFYTHFCITYVGGPWPTAFDTSILNMTCVVSTSSSASIELLKGAKFILYISTTERAGATPGDNYGNNSRLDEEKELLLKYTFVAEDGEVEQDSFLGEANNPNDPSAQGSGSKKIDWDDASGWFTLDGVYSDPIKYARIVLCNASSGKPLSDQSKLTVTYDETSDNVKAAGEDGKLGWYVYNNGETLAKDKIKITLENDGTIANYIVKCYLAKGTDGAIVGADGITHEPNWDFEYTYSFAYSVKTRDIYLKAWDTNTTTINLLDLMSEDLPDFNSNSSTGYISWAIYNGPYGSGGSRVDFWGSPWNIPVSTWAMHFNSNTKSSLFIYTMSDGYLWTNFTKPDIYAPDNSNFSEYANYVAVAEVSDESAENIKVRYIFHFTEDGLEPFLGNLSSSGKEKSWTQKVNRSETPATINLQMAYGELENSDNLQYARFYLTDIKGNLVPSEGRLSVKYGNKEGELCPVTNQGYYIYTGSNLTPNDISVTFAAPNKEYKLYKVVGVFSENMENANFEGDNLTHEPDWDLQYTYSFTYNDLTVPYHTDESCKVEWKKNTGMEPIVSGNPDVWGTSWAELGVEQYVKWYVVDGNNTTQPLVMGTGRQGDTETWAINVSGFKVANDVAVLTEQSTFTPELWNTWGHPAIYAPAGVDYANVQDYKIICKIYANSTGEGEPNAHYTFSLYKSFLGELRDDDSRRKGSETKDDLDKSVSTVTLSLENALNSYEAANLTRAAGTLQYARIWLEKTDGTKEAPGEKLVIDNSAVKLYGNENNDYAIYGYYLSGDDINETLKGLTATLNLPEAFNQYQVHVALSTDAPIMDNGKVASEPDYDYEYVYTFSYLFSAEEITILLDESVLESSSYKIERFSEIPEKFGKSSQDFAKEWYARWYVESPSGERQPINNSQEKKNNDWSITHYWGENETIDWPSWRWRQDLQDKTLWSDHAGPGERDTDFIRFKFLVSTPNGNTMDDYSGYKIIFEVTDENPDAQPSVTDGDSRPGPPNNLPVIKLRYIFEIPKGDPFLGKANASALTINAGREIGREETSADIPLSNTDFGNDIKYVRVVLCNPSGKAVDDQSILEVKYNTQDAIKAGKKDKNGVYVYAGDNGTLDLSQVSITLNAGVGKMNKYIVKCLLSTGEMTGSGEDLKEPDWDYVFIYKFTYPFSGTVIYKMLDESVLESSSLQLNSFSELSQYVPNYQNEWYARWYVKDANGKEQTIRKYSGNCWGLTHYWDNYEGDTWPSDRWVNDGEYMLWSDHTVNNGKNNEFLNFNFLISTPNNGIFDKFSGYQIIFEITDEHEFPCEEHDQWGSPTDLPPLIPDIKLRYIFEIPVSFPAKLKEEDKKIEKTIHVSTRSAESVSIDITDAVNSFDSDQKPIYVRFYLTDTKGNLVNPADKLIMTYSGNGSVTERILNQGFYIYNSGGPVDLTNDKINVQLNAPGAYKLYKVVAVFATDKETAEFKSDGTMVHEPDWDLQYIYDFIYDPIDTKDFSKDLEWRKTGMEPTVSTDNPETDWNISLEELGVEYSVKWYIQNANGNKQELVAGSSRQADKWVISGYIVDDAQKEAVYSGQGTFLFPYCTVYAPDGMDDYNDVKGYQIVCEIYANSTGNGTPNARYTFSLVDSFLGELKSKGKTGGKVVEVKNDDDSFKTLSLSDASNAWGSTGQVKYARVWLTTTDGTMVDPTGKLSQPSGMTNYTTEGKTDVTYGYYLYNENGISLANITATLNLDIYSYEQYQVHIALSTESLVITDGKATSEPDYDYIYTFSFSSPWKTKYKTLIFDEESYSCTPHLIENWQELALECGEGRENLAKKLYVRWYLTDLEGNIIRPAEFRNDNYNQTNYYRNSFDAGNLNDGNFNWRGNNGTYNPTIKLPQGYSYNQVHVVCLVTTKTEGYTANPWTKDPDEIQVKYIYTLKTERELQNLPFIHYQGEAYRYLMESGNESEAEKYNYKDEGDLTVANYSWDSNKNDIAKKTFGMIHQNVYTVDYYFYVNDGDDVELTLPLQYYKAIDPNSNKKGSSTEPKAYYRWYDYDTDMTSPYLSKYNNSSALRDDYYNGERGLFVIRLWEDPNVDNVAVNFKPDFSKQNEFQIACDVSRYMDGMDESFKYLIHEPTLSVRYLFHIQPASVIANEIRNKAKANDLTASSALQAVENKIMNRAPSDKISILENKGRIVVSLNENVGDFSLRTQLSDLNHYYIGNEPAKTLWWYAYYQDKDGNWWRHLIADKPYNDKDGYPIQRSEMYQAKYSLGDLQGDWELINGTDGKAPVISTGDRVQMVGCISTGNTANKEQDMPIIWAELEFIDAKPLELNSEELNDSERSPGNMWTEFGEPDALLNFNEYSLYGLKKPTNSYENYATMPLEFRNAQYGYCYPTLYGLCATNKPINNWAGYGISPMHGDYMLLKSMNMPRISMDEEWEKQSIFCNWWEASGEQLPLYDVTHERAIGGKDSEDTNTDNNYGSFLYVDAADEARTIAKLEFNAKLCSNARIYYTAYIASMTGTNFYGEEQTPPMVRFRVTTDGDTPGERVPVVMFVTGDIKQEVNHDGSFSHATWYQVYGYTTIPAEVGLNGSDRTYYVEIDNYCDNTDGADYCIDQISFYTTNASLKVKQTVNRECDDRAVDLNIYVSKEDLDNNEVKKLYWRIYETSEKGNKALTDPEIYKNGDKSYGEVDIPTTFDPDKTPEEDDFNNNPNVTSGYFKGAKDVYYFSLTKGRFVLEEGREYFISVYELNYDPAEGGGLEWGCKDSPCSIYSEFFVPKAMYVSAVNEAGDEVTEIEVDCSGTTARVDLKMVLYLPDEKEEDGFKRYEGVHFDYFIGTKQEFIDYHINHNNADIYLRDALTHFRERHDKAETAINFEDKKFNKPYTKDDLSKIGPEYKGTADYVDGYYEVIYQAVHAGLLHLSCSEDVNLLIDDKHSTIVVLPVDDCVEDNKNKYPICSPLAFTFDVEPSKGAPQLALGFDDVEYPKDYVRVVRVGKEQLSNMQKADGGFMLHIPIHSFSGRDETESSSIVFESPNLVLSETTDPTKDTSTDIVVATLQGDGVTNRPVVDDAHQYLAIKFNDSFTFHEGFEYELHTRYYDIADNGEDNKPNVSACIGDLWLIIKVVPEYVTWNDGGSVTENNNQNDNWNNDANWSRSKKGELYKTNNYEDNSEIFGENYKGTPASFVPMKFTYVTIPSGNRAPKLINLTRGTTSKKDMGIYTNIGTTATDNIQYDLMVRYTEEYCLGHGKITSGTENIYDCEKFYGNWAKEIYFKPGAELVYQHYLTYEKVWVEKLLTANTWTLMSTPLQNTYAGDMYVPYSTDATKNGRQETEAFQDITFGTGYSRTLYPIYQRSWAQAGSTVYTSTDDMYRSNYSANLSGTVSSTFTLWSHTYNDVMVDYSKWKGFAIRAHKKAQKDNQGNNVLALLRLPKKDTNFSYYDWNGDSQSTGLTISRGKYGKLFTDDETAEHIIENDDVTYGVDYDYGTGGNSLQERTAEDDGIVKESVNEIQSAQGYQLVGNPYLCSINMEKFLSVNKDNLDESGYWTYENNFAKAYTKGQIRPLQSFFVKAKSGVELQFNESMMIDGNTSPIESQPALTMTASNDSGQSSATVSVGEETKHVETLLDSNLEEVPMVYTVADGQAVSINQLTELTQPIAFGVTCVASDELVAVTFTDVEQLTMGEVRVVDAMTGEQTTISEGSTLHIQPNDYGRYFLLAGATDISDKMDVQKGIMVSVRGKEVTVTSGEELTQVRALTLNGALMYQHTAGGNETSFTLGSGVYIIQAENVAGEQQTVKVVVR